MIKILMVCLGNICRSPLAEGILAAKLPQNKFKVDSAGTGNWHVGQKPDERSIAVAKKHGLDISKQTGRQFTYQDFQNYEYIFVMDNVNYNDTIKLAKTQEDKNKVARILDATFPEEKIDVPDPYLGTEKDFQSVFQMLDQSCETLAKKLIEKHTP